MIGWDVYMIFALISVGMWTIGAVAAFRYDEGCSRWSVWTTMAGIVVYAVFIGGLWASLSRPPLRTLGETRLRYSLFMMVAALIVYIRWRYR